MRLRTVNAVQQAGKRVVSSPCCSKELPDCKSDFADENQGLSEGKSTAWQARKRCLNASTFLLRSVGAKCMQRSRRVCIGGEK